MVAHGKKIWVTTYGSNNFRLVEDSGGPGLCVDASHANGLGASLTDLSSNDRGLSSPGLEFTIVVIG